MAALAPSPDQLETLLEDAYLLPDADAPARLFDPRAVLVTAGRRPARGWSDIGDALAALWAAEHTYVAGQRRIVAAGDTALVAGQGVVHVMRRDRERSWRYHISVLGRA